MPLRWLDNAPGLVHQVSGSEDVPPVVYLPGIHGDWTPLEGARPRLNAKVRLIEAAYPRVDHWTLNDFADALDALLDDLGLQSAHVVGESFGSLVGWQFGLTRPDRVRSFVLIGGFSQAPNRRSVRSAKWALRLLPTFAFEKGIDTYVSYKSRKGERRPSHGPEIPPYPAARTRRGKRATMNRMTIVQRTDFRGHLDKVTFPVRYIGGEMDRVVPVHRELATLAELLPPHCEFDARLLARAPHAIIASHPEETSAHICDWVSEIELMVSSGVGDQRS